MKKSWHQKRRGRCTDGGFTLVEILIVLAITLILMGIALPPYLSWRNNLSYRQAARGMTSMLREARTLAITRNRQHMVVFKPNSSSYKLIPGSQAYNTPSTGWNATPLQDQNSPSNTTFRSMSTGTSTGNVYVQFNPNGTAKLAAPNGTASNGSITVNEGSSRKFVITVTTAGRIKMVKRN